MIEWFQVCRNYQIFVRLLSVPGENLKEVKINQKSDVLGTHCLIHEDGVARYRIQFESVRKILRLR